MQVTNFMHGIYFARRLFAVLDVFLPHNVLQKAYVCSLSSFVRNLYPGSVNKLNVKFES